MVLGSRGLGAMAGFLVGSLSQAVLAHAERPVVVVRSGTWMDTSYQGPAGSPAPRAACAAHGRSPARQSM
ncbi:universal stress protein [Streptomyces sp. PvR034]|uniref:universal stress protein n=1 Tax=Streptomyces sp. PvR034 TaxID=3156401 RepID=UPI003394F3DA